VNPYMREATLEKLDAVRSIGTKVIDVRSPREYAQDHVPGQ